MKTPRDMSHGSIHESKNYGPFEIKEYRGANNILVRFISTGFETETRSHQIRSGKVKDLLKPSVCGVGYLGVGNYKCSDGNGKHTSAYTRWHDMIHRCYSKKEYKQNECYESVIVCDEWHNFQNFADWFYKNHPYDLQCYDIDKDINSKKVKIYSPETCMFVTKQENAVAANAGHFTMISPIGEIVEIYNMSEFCRKNGLSQSKMSLVANGKRKSHKGWTKGA